MSQPVTPAERLNKITEDGMCIGCGLCQSLAGPDRVQMYKVENGYERPVVVGDLDHETVDQIYDVCPGTRLDGLPPELIDEATQTDLVWGPYQRMVRAFATDPDVRWKASTGGVLTALGQYLIESGEVDYILHVKPHSIEATFGERHVSYSQQDVLEGAGSRYGPTAPLIDVHKYLDKSAPFAFIGKPCDIAAMRNLGRTDARLGALVKFYLTPVCGGFMPPDGMNTFLRERENVDPDSLTEYRYRGHGCPGLMRYATKYGKEREFRYTDFWGTDESMWSLPFKCKVCPDGIGEAADIAASDTWPGGSPDPEIEDQDAGTNAVTIRTKAGLDLVQRAVKAGFLTIEGEVGPRYMDHVQPHQTKKKYAVRARWDGLGAEGRIVPRSTGLRLDALRATLSEDDYSWQFEGTRKRVRTGKTSEPTPKPAP